jgi:hypothetical protein
MINLLGLFIVVVIIGLLIPIIGWFLLYFLIIPVMTLVALIDIGIGLITGKYKKSKSND